MARVFFTYELEITPDSNPDTLIQIIAAANHQAVLHAIQAMPLGLTAATAPLEWVLSKQTDAGGTVDDSANIQKDYPEAAETIQTTIGKGGAGAEPTTTDKKESFTIHQQGTRLWKPGNPRGVLFIPGGTRMGIISVAGVYVNQRLRLYLEE